MSTSTDQRIEPQSYHPLSPIGLDPDWVVSMAMSSVATKLARLAERANALSDEVKPRWETNWDDDKDVTIEDDEDTGRPRSEIVAEIVALRAKMFRIGDLCVKGINHYDPDTASRVFNEFYEDPAWKAGPLLDNADE